MSNVKLEIAADMYTFLVTYIKMLSAFLIALALSLYAVFPVIPAQASADTVSKADPILSQGVKLLRKRQFLKAIEKFTIIINQEPTGDNRQALSLYNRGLAYQALGRLQQARSDYTQALKRRTLSDKILVVVYYNRGLVHDALKRPNAALADFTSAIDKNPEFSPAYHNLGNVLRKMGRNKPAIKKFLKSLELGNPQPYLTYLGLAMAYEGAGRRKEAIISLKYALDIRPRFKQASDMLARLTTENLYTFPSGMASLPDGSPAVTGSIPRNAATQSLSGKSSRVIGENQSQKLGLRGFVEVETQPVQYKKLALRGTLNSASLGRVSLVVPGPGLKEAQSISNRLTPLPRKRPVRSRNKPARGNFRVQLGISKTSAKANKIWFFLRAQNEDLLKDLTPVFQRVNLGTRGILYRIQVGPFRSRQAADQLCEIIKERAVNCFTVGINS